MLTAEEKKKEKEGQTNTETISEESIGSDVDLTDAPKEGGVTVGSNDPSTEDHVMMENPYPPVYRPTDDDVLAYLRYLTARLLSPTEQEMARQSFPKIFNG